MKDSFSVSIVMITYNGGKYLREQLDSLLAQTVPFAELIVRDDGSTDDTMDILREYASRDGRIKIFVNKQNLGWNMNFITAMKDASNDFIALSDQDDIWYSCKLEKELENIGDSDLIYSYRDKGPDYASRHRIVGRPQPDFESLLFTSHVPGHTMLFRRSFCESIDAWNPDVAYDWWLALQSHLHGGITLVREPLNWHRPHEDSASSVLMKADWERTKITTWQPYIYGWRAYRRFQRMEVWQWLYGYLRDHTSDGRHPLAHEMASLMVRPGLFPLLRLCRLTMLHRSEVHERFAGGRGVAHFFNMVRGFFYPLIWTYNNNTSFLQKPPKE